MDIQNNVLPLLSTNQINTMNTQYQLSEGLLKKIQNDLEKTNPEVYWDYNDELSSEQIVTAIKGGLQKVAEEIWDSLQNYGNIYQIERGHIIESLKTFKNEITAELLLDDPDFEFDAKELAEELRDELIDYVSVDMNLNQLLKNTGLVNIRIEMGSNYDCINSHWFETSGGGGYEYEQSYFGDMVDQLNLNPAKVKKMLLEHDIKCFGVFPNKKNRDGKEFVSYTDFWQELENSSCGVNQLTFLGRIDLRDLDSKDGYLKPIGVTIPAGNNCGLFSSMQGGGSVMEMKLLRDKKIDLVNPFARNKTKYDTYHLFVEGDKNGGYGIDQVYGVTSEFFGKEVALTTVKQEY